LSPELVDQLEHGIRTAWLPLTQDAEFVRGVVEAMGHDAARAMWRKYAVRFKDEPMIKPLYEASIRLFGFDLIGFCRAVSRFYSAEYRGMGTLEAIPQDDGSVVVMLTEAPAIMFEGGYYQTLFTGMFEGMYDVAKLPEPMLTVTSDVERQYMQVILDRETGRRG
jgi:hypothetical protein